VDVNLNIEEKEINFVKNYLKGKTNPIDLQEVAYQVALFKTSESRSHRVKIYNPNCEYKIGDLIYKEYPGKIPIGGKKFIEMDRGVVLKVVGVRTRNEIHEIQLKYEGTSEFKKYTTYLERQKIELLLPHKQARPCEKGEYLSVDNDPRKDQAPLEKRDFTALTKKLASVLNKDPQIALVSQRVLVKDNLKPIDNSVFDKIKDFLRENKKSETTEFFVENFARIRPEDENFAAYCFALNYRMSIDYKIDFQQTQDLGWGKWNLISVIYYMKKNSLISEENPLIQTERIANKKNLALRRKRFQDSMYPDGGIHSRYYLTQREISAGAVRLKPGFFDLGESIEVELVDGKQKKTYLVFHYKDDHLMLGLKEIFDRYKALQGTILAFELVADESGEGPVKLHFNIRTTKKGTIADRVEYVPENKAYRVTEEKVASYVFVNKSIFLESSVINALYEQINEFRKIKTLNKLIHKVFLEFGIKERNYEIHILRLYHILDLIYPMDIKQVEEVILGNEEFVPAEKIAGVFYLDSDAVTEIEEEELKRKEFQKDEDKKKREELRRKKLDQERRIKEEIRRKREERRRKREQEMWEKERMRKEMEEKKAQEIKKKKEKEAQRKAAQKAEKLRKERERARRPEKRRGPEQRRPSHPPPTQLPHPHPHPPPPSHPHAKPQKPYREKETPFKHKPEAPKPPASPVELPVPPEEISRKKEYGPKWVKKVERDEEKIAAKPHKKVERRLDEETMSEDEIKSQIELEKLKEKIRDRKNIKEADKKETVVYKDDSRFSGILASKLDEIVKKDDDKKEKEKK
jgi:hypothetical protein